MTANMSDGCTAIAVFLNFAHILASFIAFAPVEFLYALKLIIVIIQVRFSAFLLVVVLFESRLSVLPLLRF